MNVPSMKDNTAVETKVNGNVCGFKPSFDAIASPSRLIGIRSTITVLTGNAMENPFRKIGTFTVPMAITGNTILRAMLIIKEIHMFKIKLNLLNIFFIKLPSNLHTHNVQKICILLLATLIYNLTNT